MQSNQGTPQKSASRPLAYSQTARIEMRVNHVENSGHAARYDDSKHRAHTHGDDKAIFFK
jgi:hypothetical protein